MKQQFAYAGFWIRTAASIIDTVLIVAIISPLLTAIYGKDYWLSESAFQGVWDLLLSYIFPAAAIIVFWVYKSATPGKILLKLTVIDAATGGKPSTPQFIGRYLGYYLAAIPLLLGIFWVGFDKRKQGWHDKLAGTLVVKNHYD
jgi:uncharacterized RDD family membrane protein YckC